MAGPFYNGIKGTTAGAPGTGAFTPNAAATGHLAWSTIAAGWIGLVRFEDGTAWELRYGYWNGTTISRPSNIVESSTGSALTLSSSATAAMVVDAAEIQPHLGSVAARAYVPNIGAATYTAIGFPAATLTGTAAAAAPSNTNALTASPRVQLTSATTANAQAGLSSGATVQVLANHVLGGWEFTARLGVSGVPTGPRVFVGMTGGTFVANAAEPSAFVQNYAVLAKDSTDTNLQFLCNANTTTGTKIDTGLPLTINQMYDISIWQHPNSSTVFMLAINLTAGTIYYGSTTTDVPAGGAGLFAQCLSGLSATTGTAIVMHVGQVTVRCGI